MPALVGAAFVDYLTIVRGVTPPAKGARVVGSVDFARGKAAIEVDLRRAFIVSAKGAVSTLAGSAAVAKIPTRAGRKIAARLSKVMRLRDAKKFGRLSAQGIRLGGQSLGKEIVSAADEDPRSWYESQRRNGRFHGTQKMEIDLSGLNNIRRALVARVGYLQSGWNAASQRFGASMPSWAANKSGPGSVATDRTSDRYQVRADNQVPYAGGIDGMQRRLDYAGRVVAKRLEEKAAARAEQEMQRIINL